MDMINPPFEREEHDVATQIACGLTDMDGAEGKRFMGASPHT